MFEKYFKILNLKPDADMKSIKKAYRHLALKYHPDVNTQPEAHEKFLEICEAYEIIISERAKQNRIYVNREEEKEESDTIYEEILREARAKAEKRARMKYKKIKAEKDFFRNNDIFVLLRYLGNYLAIPFSFLLIIFPIIIAFREGIQMFFALFFFWIIGSVILIHIYTKRKTWFHPGKIDTTWYDIVNAFKLEKKKNPNQYCMYSRNRFANSGSFSFMMFKINDVKMFQGGISMHRVAYKREFKKVIVPRSTHAYLMHSILSFLKPTTLILCFIYLPIPSFAWRFIFSFVASFLFSQIILILSAVHPKTSFLLTRFMILKLLIYLAVTYSQTTIYPGLVLYTAEVLPYLYVVMILFLDMIMDLILRVLPVYYKIYLPILKQPLIIKQLYAKSYRDYLDIPIWSSIYPFLRWLF